MQKKSILDWQKHWNAKDKIENPIEMNGYCVAGKPIGREEYNKLIIEPYLRRLKLKNKAGFSK